MAYRAPDLKPKQAARDAPRLAWVIDAVAGGRPDPRPAWEQTIRRLAQKSPVQPRAGGSWNIPVLAMVDRAIMDDGNRDWQRLEEYCGNQLGGDSLWGQELLSAQYCWPPVALALALDKARDRGRTAVAGKLQDLTDAHALLMALCALPRPHREAKLRTGFNFHVCAPGIRNDKPTSVGIWRDYWLGCMLRPRQNRPGVPPLYNNRDHGNWKARISQVVRATASQEVRNTILQHIPNGSRAADIVARLNRLGVTLQATLHIRRHAGGDGSAWFERDLPVPTKAPTMAESGVGGVYHVLHAHPAGFNSNKNRPKGQATCRLAAGELREKVTGFGRDRRELNVSIPAPTGTPLYHLVIDRQGARAEGSPPPPVTEPPVTEPPVTEPPAPGGDEMDRSVALLARAMPGLRREPALATVRAVLRRIFLEEAGRSAPGGSAFQGARALVIRLRELAAAGTSPAGPWQADIERAAQLAAAAGQGLRRQQILATAAAVVNRIGLEEAGRSAPGGSALQGAQALVQRLHELGSP